jgi:hypothetical protein
MTDHERQRAQDEIDRLLNDTQTPFQADEIWDLLERVRNATVDPPRSYRCQIEPNETLRE